MSSSPKVPGPSRTMSVIIFIAISLALLAAGYGYYRSEAGKIRLEKHEELAAIGDLKTGQIQAWRKERLADAARFASGPVLRRFTEAFLRNPASKEDRAILLEQMRLDRMGDQYHEVLMVAPDGRVALSTEEPPAAVNPATQQVVAAALAMKTPLLSDLFHEPDGSVHIDAAAPVLGPEGQPLAVLLLRSRANDYLFPLIQSWPTPSVSAETELIQRDGQYALYLNELRHSTGSALAQRVPLSQVEHPAAQAVLGRQGEFQGKDYRGIKVLADLRGIPDSPWFIVAKVDASEILAEARYRAEFTGILVGSLVLLSGAGVAYVYRHKQAGLFRELYASEQRQQESHRLFRATIETGPECVKLVDRNGRLVEMNPAGLAMLEADSLREAQDRGLMGFIHPDHQPAFRDLHNTVMSGGSGTLEFEVTGLRGTQRWLETHAAPLLDGKGQVSMLLGITRDITERKVAEARIQRLTQLYLALSQCNQAIVRATDEAALFAEVCRGAVLFGGMKMAWIGLADATRRIVPVASFGDEFSYLEDIEISLDAEDPHGRGPTGTAIREDQPFWCQDFQHDPATAPWHERGSRSGWQSSAALPLHRNGQAVGALMIYAGDANAFDEDARRLLMEMTADISHALDAFEAEAARKQADEALRASLREKESLLKEIHHRVKNNLQVITSLLRLEAGRSAHPETRSVLKEMQNRIRSMALLHESLYRSENLEQVDLPAYIRQLTTHLFRSMLAKPGSIQLELELAPVSLPLEQAVPCGLLVNELVSNCLKHGFPDGRAGKVRIELQTLDDGQSIRLQVSDTGVGLPADFEEKSATSLGLQLVADLARQLKGQLEVNRAAHLGAAFEVIFEARPTST